jgi:hypothetical protein
MGAAAVVSVTAVSACASASRTSAAGGAAAGGVAGGGGATSGGATSSGAASGGAASSGAVGSLPALTTVSVARPAVRATPAGSSPAASSPSTGPFVRTDPSTCGPSSLDASFDVQPDGGISESARLQAVIVVTDRSMSPCTLSGFPAVDVVVDVRSSALGGRDVDQLARPLAVVLESAQSAFAGMEWTAAAGCAVVSSFRLVLPGHGGVVPVGLVAPGTSSLSKHVCAGDIELGPFAATSAESLAFPDSVDGRS